jgi:hypothetical protein
LVVSMTVGIAAAQPPAAAPPASPKGERTVPVEPATRRKIQAVFTKHAGQALPAFQRARAGVMQALLDGSDVAINTAKADFDRRTAELDAAKQTIAAELKRAGISTAVQDQEWKAWATAQSAQAKASADAK